MAMQPRYLPRREAAVYAGISTRTLDRLLTEQTLTRYRLRGKTLVDRQELDRLVRRSAQAAKAM